MLNVKSGGDLNGLSVGMLHNLTGMNAGSKSAVDAATNNLASVMCGFSSQPKCEVERDLWHNRENPRGKAEAAFRFRKTEDDQCTGFGSCAHKRRRSLLFV